MRRAQFSNWVICERISFALKLESNRMPATSNELAVSSSFDSTSFDDATEIVYSFLNLCNERECD